ncbi:MAG: hypothetical protein RLZZ213_1294 [Cyanobacteriota bacterium]
MEQPEVGEGVLGFLGGGVAKQLGLASSVFPTCLATSAKNRYLRLAMLSPPKAASRLAWVRGLEMSMGLEGSIGLGGDASDSECSLSEVITTMS